MKYYIKMKTTEKICPFCKNKLIGETGKRICSNIKCGAYEVNDSNYDLKRNKRQNISQH
jgi:hypothetical protein